MFIVAGIAAKVLAPIHPALYRGKTASGGGCGSMAVWLAQPFLAKLWQRGDGRRAACLGVAWFGLSLFGQAHGWSWFWTVRGASGGLSVPPVPPPNFLFGSIATCKRLQITATEPSHGLCLTNGFMTSDMSRTLGSTSHVKPFLFLFRTN